MTSAVVITPAFVVLAGWMFVVGYRAPRDQTTKTVAYLAAWLFVFMAFGGALSGTSAMTTAGY